MAYIHNSGAIRKFYIKDGNEFKETLLKNIKKGDVFKVVDYYYPSKQDGITHREQGPLIAIKDPHRNSYNEADWIEFEERKELI